MVELLERVASKFIEKFNFTVYRTYNKIRYISLLVVFAIYFVGDIAEIVKTNFNGLFAYGNSTVATYTAEMFLTEALVSIAWIFIFDVIVNVLDVTFDITDQQRKVTRDEGRYRQ